MRARITAMGRKSRAIVTSRKRSDSGGARGVFLTKRNLKRRWRGKMRTTLVTLILLAVIASALAGCGANNHFKFGGPNTRNAPPYR
jgi:hypothetical protein